VQAQECCPLGSYGIIWGAGGGGVGGRKGWVNELGVWVWAVRCAMIMV
jgi:hypothetical protein